MGEPMVMGSSVCPECNGHGWIEGIDHDPRCYQAGDCIGCGGVQIQVQCPVCHGSGDNGSEPQP